MRRFTTEFGHDSTAAEVVRGIDLTGRRIVVTGAASGMGAMSATALSAHGAAVAVLDINESGAIEVAASLGSMSGVLIHVGSMSRDA